MPEFKKRELSTDQPLGKQLRAVRRTAKLSLEQVEMGTKIRKKFLRAIEEGNYDEFPAEVYLRGFLENYAQFLGFPADEVLLQYKRERGVSGAPESPNLPGPRSRVAESRLTITPRTLWLGLGALTLFVAVGYIVSQLFGFAAPPDLVVDKPGQNATVTSETVEVTGKTDSGAELAINNQPVPTDTDGRFTERVRLLPGPNTLRVSAKNKTGRQKVVTRSVIVQLPGQASPVPTASPVPSGLLLTLKIGPNSAYVTVTVDGAVAFQGLLLANTEQSFSGRERILLTTSNAGSTRVLLNGQDRGPVGGEGQFRRGIEYLVSEILQPSPSPQPQR